MNQESHLQQQEGTNKETREKASLQKVILTTGGDSRLVLPLKITYTGSCFLKRPKKTLWTHHIFEKESILE